ncbi:MAG: NAD(P)-binding protein [Colwellia sp.]
MSNTDKSPLDKAGTTPEKIAILGTGVAAMTSAFYLTDQPDWQEKYDITIYQMGWRAGGKGASGVNSEYGQRIEEHGLHIWFGFYNNAFKTIQGAYNYLDRPEGAALRTWQDAFKPHSYIALEEYIKKDWETWAIDFPTNDLIPGTAEESISLLGFLSSAFSWVKGAIDELEPHLVSSNSEGIKQWLAQRSKEIGKELHSIEHATLHLKTLIDALPKPPSDHDNSALDTIFDLFKKFKELPPLILNPILNEDANIRHLFIVADLGLTIITGMIEDDVFIKGFDVINNYDYREWLIKHGANVKFTANSVAVRGFYDLAFAYEGGDTEKPNIEAGTMLRSFLRISLSYRGAIMWKMQAGMGDTIFAPFYQALMKRGVKFEFFNKVEELIPNGNTISTIKLTKQVNLKKGLKQYDPFVKVQGHCSAQETQPLECWPSKPNYDQLDPAQADLLQKYKVNLESLWSDWATIYRDYSGRPLPEITLEKGVDFDKIIFGISIASLEHLCPKLLEKSEPLRRTAEKVKTVVTQAYQVWNNVTLEGLGWAHYPPTEPGSATVNPVLSGFVEPFDTWASMDQLICREDWPAHHQPQNIAYFCNVMPMASFPPASDYSFPAECAEMAKQNAMTNLTEDIYNLWPEVAKKGEFNWDILVDIHNKEGKARFDSQYWRANIDPSERYVQSVTNSTQYRLATDESGFENLYLTGDWIKTGLNVGCVEAATMAGMQTSRAICGYPEIIYGESDFK